MAKKGSDYAARKGRLKEAFAAGTYFPAYLIFGEEDYLRKYEKEETLKRFNVQKGDMNFSRFVGEDIRADAVIDLAVTLPFFADRRVILVENSGWFAMAGRKSKDTADEKKDAKSDDGADDESAGGKEEAKKLIEYLREPAPDTSIIFVEQNVAASTGLFKAVDKCGFTLSCDPPPEAQLRRWMQNKAGENGKKLERAAEDKLLTLTATGRLSDPRIDMNMLLSEISKVSAYCGERDTIRLEDVDAVCSDSLTDNVYKIVDRMAERDRAGAMKLYQEMMESKPSPFWILSMIIGRFNGILMVSELLDRNYPADQIASKTKLAPFVVSLCSRWRRKYTRERLLEILAYCAGKEKAVKRGQMADVIALESVITFCSSDEQAERKGAGI